MTFIPEKKDELEAPRENKKDLSHLFLMRSRLVIAFTFLFAAAFTVVSIVSYNVSKSFILKDIEVEVQEVLNAHASEVDQWLKNMISVVSSSARIIETGIPHNRMITPELLSNFGSNVFFSDMYFSGANGEFTSGREWKSPADYDPGKRPWYIAAVDKKRTVVTKPYIGVESGSPEVSVAAPVYRKNGSLRGVLSADLLLSTLADKLDVVRVRGKGFAAMIDGSGRVLVHQNKSLLGKDITEDSEIGDAVKQILLLKRGRIDYGIKEKKYVIFTIIPSTGWYMGIVFRKEEINSNLRYLAYRFNQIFAVSIVVVLAVSIYFAKRLTLFTELLENEIEVRTSELRDKVAEVEYLSLTDPLTGIANRRKIQSILEDEIARSERNSNPLSVISIDLDHFKRINDTYGHEAGDNVLVAATTSINGVIRSVDHAGRMGGEEFIVVCPDTPEPGAYFLAEKLRTVIESLSIPGAGSITASFGYATRVPDESIDRFLSRADSALYRAKERGRNRVEPG